MMKSLHASIVLVCFLAANSATAETILVPRAYDVPNGPEGVARPVRGMSMDAVLARFGEPTRRLPAVGEPPITRWIYERFTVYFEGSTTLDAVVYRK